MVTIRQCIAGLASVGSALAASSCAALKVKHQGAPAGELKNVSGIEMYHAYPPHSNSSDRKAIIHLTDIFGVPLLENKLLADSLAANGYTVIVPDLFAGDAISVEEQEAGLNLTEWFTQHPQSEIERIVDVTLRYARTELGFARIGAVGYCFGGKYVSRYLAAGRGVDAGFVAHPSNLLEDEIRAVAGPLSIAAGTLDASFNATARYRAEGILDGNNITFQSSVYAQAPHGFAVRPNLTVPQQVFSKEGAFVQAVTFLDAWL